VAQKLDIQNSLTSAYIIETEYFGVSDEGIHLLRERYNYETIPWQAIRTIKIHRDRELHNWFAIACMSSAMFAVALYFGSEILDTILETQGWPLFKLYVLILLVAAVSAFFVFKSVRKTWVLRIQCKTKQKLKFPLDEVFQRKQLSLLEAMLEKKLTKSVEK
jgi:hypothetical protein